MLVQQVPLLDACEEVDQAGLPHAGVTQQHHSVPGIPEARGARGVAGAAAAGGPSTGLGGAVAELGVTGLTPRSGPRATRPRERGASPAPQWALAAGLRVQSHHQHQGQGSAGWAGEWMRPEGHPHPANPDRAAAAPGAAPALSRRQLEHNFPGTPALLSAPGFKPREVEPLAGPIPPLPDTPPPARASARPCRPVPEVSSGFAVPGSSEFPRDPYLGHGEQR